MMRRFSSPQLVFIIAFFAACWYGMMLVHELGHAIGGVLGGGRVALLDLPLIGFSSTYVEPNPRPLLERWAGPVGGVVVPIAAWLGLWRWRGRAVLLARFFAGLCLIANGAYLGLGWIDGVGDAGDLVRLGMPVWWLMAFGVVATPAGLVLWHRTGPAFGLGPDARPVHWRHAFAAAAALAALCIVAIIL